MRLDLCEICDGSGVLNILEYAPAGIYELIWQHGDCISYCHACPAGEAWREAGLE